MQTPHFFWRPGSCHIQVRSHGNSTLVDDRRGHRSPTEQPTDRDQREGAKEAPQLHFWTAFGLLRTLNSAERIPGRRTVGRPGLGGGWSMEPRGLPIEHTDDHFALGPNPFANVLRGNATKMRKNSNAQEQGHRPKQNSAPNALCQKTPCNPGRSVFV